MSFSLLELRDSQENGLVSLRAGGGAAACEVAAGGGGGATAAVEGFGLREGDSELGDQGIAGSALVMLLRERVLLGGSFSGGLLGSVSVQR